MVTTTPSPAATAVRDPDSRRRFHGHWNNTSPLSSGAEEEGWAGLSASAVVAATVTATAADGEAIRSARFHSHWNHSAPLSANGGAEEEDAGSSAAVAATDGDAVRSARFHDHWSNTNQLSASGGAEERGAGASATATNGDNTRAITVADAIQSQYDSDPRWQYLSAFEGRARHSHWNNGFGESATPLGGGETDDESSQGSSDGYEETASRNNAHGENDRNQIIMVDSIINPRFPGMRKLFSRGGSSAVRS